MELTHEFDRRTLISRAIALSSLTWVLGACARDNKTAGAVITHATGKDDLVLRIGFEGGFTAPSFQFVRIPTLLISGDGRVITAGAQTEIFPGPLLPALYQRSINEAGILNVLVFADKAKLIQPPPDYTADLHVADAPNTVVIVSANGQTYKHSAYALGMGSPESTTARKCLAAFVAQMSNIESVAGLGNLGQDAPLVPDNYLVQARELADSDLAAYDPPAHVMAWPTNAGVSLGATSTCAVVPAAKVDAVLKTATQNTVFTDAAKTYQVAAIALLPGDQC